MWGVRQSSARRLYTRLAHLAIAATVAATASSRAAWRQSNKVKAKPSKDRKKYPPPSPCEMGVRRAPEDPSREKPPPKETAKAEAAKIDTLTQIYDPPSRFLGVLLPLPPYLYAVGRACKQINQFFLPPKHADNSALFLSFKAIGFPAMAGVSFPGRFGSSFLRGKGVVLVNVYS